MTWAATLSHKPCSSLMHAAQSFWDWCLSCIFQITFSLFFPAVWGKAGVLSKLQMSLLSCLLAFIACAILCLNGRNLVSSHNLSNFWPLFSHDITANFIRIFYSQIPYCYFQKIRPKLKSFKFIQKKLSSYPWRCSVFDSALLTSAPSSIC